MQIDDIGAATSHDFKKKQRMIPQRHYFKSMPYFYKLLQITITKLLI